MDKVCKIFIFWTKHMLKDKKKKIKFEINWAQAFLNDHIFFIYLSKIFNINNINFVKKI